MRTRCQVPYLDQDKPEDRITRRSGGIFVGNLQLVVDLVRRLSDKEEPPTEQDHITPGKGIAKYGKERGRQPHKPGDREEQCDPKNQRQREPNPSHSELL